MKLFEIINNDDFHDPYSLTNILLKHVFQVVLEYQVHVVIGLQGYASHS